MKKRISFKTLLKILYVKWIMGECRHLCCACKFHNMCFDNLEDDMVTKYDRRNAEIDDLK